MPTRRPRPERLQAWPLAAIAVSATLVLVAQSGGGTGSATGAPAETSWQGAVGGRPRVSVGQRMIVVLKAASLSDRVAAVGGRASDVEERGWTSTALATQRLLISRLAAEGIAIVPEFSFTRVLNGFSAPLDPKAVALVERAPEVAGVYPVRPAFPASVSADILRRPEFGAGSGHDPQISLSGIDGRGVTIALLDTGVDRTQPFLRGRVLDGIDLLGGDPGALAAASPDDSTSLERHGTELAGVLVGAGGPGSVNGVATGASVLPIRIAGWGRDAFGHAAVYGRSDLIVAGLERAVDPNDDGDTHDAARIALVALAEPFAAFADSPEARATAGAFRLDTLVVAAAGNDGQAGAGYGSVAGPGGAQAALTVGAADLRMRTDRVRVVLRSGLDVLLDTVEPLANAVAPGRTLTLPVAAPRVGDGPATAAPTLTSFFDRNGLSRVAGRAALVPATASLRAAVANAARAGASAVLVYGRSLPAGALGLDDAFPVPVVSLPPRVADELLARLRAGRASGVSLGGIRSARNALRGHVAGFSSAGLAFDGRVKPDLLGPGVGLATAEPGQNDDGSSRFGTVNGSSAAAATVAGAAALLAQARPGLGSGDLKSLLVGAAAPLAGDDVTAQGAGLVDVGAAAASEVAAAPATLAFDRVTHPAWTGRADFDLRNLSTRPLRIRMTIDQRTTGAAALGYRVYPRRLRLGPGQTAHVSLTLRTTSTPVGTQPAGGYVVATPSGGVPVRLPWAVAFGTRAADLLPSAQLSARAFKPSDTSPALLAVQAGALVRTAAGQEVRPLERLDVDLLHDDGSAIGLLARLRDVLPGSYAFGLTGRDPSGGVLPQGTYLLRVTAYPVDGGPASHRQLRFTIR